MRRAGVQPTRRRTARADASCVPRRRAPLVSEFASAFLSFFDSCGASDYTEVTEVNGEVIASVNLEEDLRLACNLEQPSWPHPLLIARICAKNFLVKHLAGAAFI